VEGVEQLQVVGEWAERRGYQLPAVWPKASPAAPRGGSSEGASFSGYLRVLGTEREWVRSWVASGGFI
jgi:hypothetical protein